MSKTGRCGANMHCRGIFGQVKVRYNILGSMQLAPSNEEF